MLRRSSVSWWREPFISLDTETTGLDFLNDRVIQVGISNFVEGEFAGGQEYVVKTGRKSCKEAVDTHHLTDEYCEMFGEKPWVYLSPLKQHLERYNPLVVIMNAPFDLNFLIMEWMRAGMEPPKFGKVVDPLVISRFYEKNRIGAFARGQRTLKSLSERYGIRDYPLHSAGHDSRRVGELAVQMAQRHGQVGRAVLSDIHKRQVRWHNQWSDDFASFADRKGFAFGRTQWPHNPYRTLNEQGVLDFGNTEETSTASGNEDKSSRA